MRLLADEHGYYRLGTVQRFDQEWESQASLRLRAGDREALAEYDQRGRILDGTREEMAVAASRRWLGDHLRGLDTVLLTTTNVQAAELARRVRAELAGLGVVERDDVVELYDGNVAGPGDLLIARQNSRITAGRQGRRLANRDVLRFELWDEIGEERFAVVRRRLGRDRRTGLVRWSDHFELSESYLERHVQLAYAGNVHVAQGRTVETAHLVVDETAGREAFYVGMSRGRQQNTAYVVHERTGPDPSSDENGRHDQRAGPPGSATCCRRAWLRSSRLRGALVQRSSRRWQPGESPAKQARCHCGRRQQPHCGGEGGFVVSKAERWIAGCTAEDEPVQHPGHRESDRESELHHCGGYA